MNQIAWLEQNISKAEKILVSKRHQVETFPNSFSARLTLQSTESHLADLCQQLAFEKSKREREVVELRLDGGINEYGTISLSLLAKLAGFISTGLLSVAYRQRKGKDPHNRIPENIVNALDLRLAGLATGSTRLFLTSSCTPDMFGYSLSEDVLEKTFAILTAESMPAITDATADAGLRSARSIGGLCKTMLESGIEIDISWDKPTGEKIMWHGTNITMERLSSTISAIAISPPEKKDISGRLIMASTKGRFEIDSADGNVYRGEFHEEILPQVRGTKIGDLVEAVIETKTTSHPVSGYEKKKHRLLSIKWQENPEWKATQKPV